MFYLEIAYVIEMWCWNLCLFMSKWDVMSKYIQFSNFLLLIHTLINLYSQKLMLWGYSHHHIKEVTISSHTSNLTTFYLLNQTQNWVNQPIQPNMKNGYPQPPFHSHTTKHTLRLSYVAIAFIVISLSYNNIFALLYFLVLNYRYSLWSKLLVFSTSTTCILIRKE